MVQYENVTKEPKQQQTSYNKRVRIGTRTS